MEEQQTFEESHRRMDSEKACVTSNDQCLEESTQGSEHSCNTVNQKVTILKFYYRL